MKILSFSRTIRRVMDLCRISSLPGFAKPDKVWVEGRSSLKDVHVCSEKKDEFLYHFGYPKYSTDFGSFS